MPQRTVRRVQPPAPIKAGWSIALSEPIALKDGTTLRTLGEAGRYVADLQGGAQSRGLNEVAGALLAAYEAPTPTNVERATHSVSAGLYFNRLLKREAS